MSSVAVAATATIVAIDSVVTIMAGVLGSLIWPKDRDKALADAVANGVKEGLKEVLEENSKLMRELIEARAVESKPAESKKTPKKVVK